MLSTEMSPHQKIQKKIPFSSEIGPSLLKEDSESDLSLS